MWHPFALIDHGHHKLLLVLSIAFTIGAMLALSSFGNPLKIERAAPYGILSFEFAGSPDSAKTIIAEWKKHDVLDVAYQSLRWDFGFIAVYTITFSFVTMLAANVYRRRGLKLAALVMTGLTLGQWLAGGFDVIENCALLHILRTEGMAHGAWPFVASVAAGLKFFLIGIGLILAFPTLFIGKSKSL